MSNENDIKIIHENNLNCDMMFKIIIIGESGVGKSCLTLRITKNNFIEDYNPTIGFENSFLYFKINDKIIKLEIWDTFGQETYRSLIKSYYRNSSLVILVYSIDDEKSFNQLNSWLKDIRAYSEQNTKIFLVGNKIDISDENRKINNEMGNKFYKDNNLNNFFETSAKTGYNIENVFMQCVKILYEENLMQNKEEKKSDTNNIIIVTDSNKVSQTCNNNCC